VGDAISEILPYAVGIAISPVPIISVILLLFSSRARVNGAAFLLGWASGLAVVGGVVYAIGDSLDVSSVETASDSVSWLYVGLGVLLLLGALHTWRRRPAPGMTPELPRWTATIDTLTPGKALALGFLLCAPVNPKNLILTIGAAVALAELGVSTEDAVVALVAFVVVASLTIAGPVGYYLVGGEKAKTGLDGLENWLVDHNSAVMTVLLFVIGVVLVSNGLTDCELSRRQDQGGARASPRGDRGGLSRSSKRACIVRMSSPSSSPKASRAARRLACSQAMKIDVMAAITTVRKATPSSMTSAATIRPEVSCGVTSP
jgi:hypothetical protein